MTLLRTHHEQEEAPSSNDRTLGAYLKGERSKRNVSLEQIQTQTGIKLTVLQALEADDRSKLPADVFVKGFVKLYAQALGLDPQYALALFQPESESGTEFRADQSILSTDSLVKTPSPLFTRRNFLLSLLVVLIAGGLFAVVRFGLLDLLFGRSALQPPATVSQPAPQATTGITPPASSPQPQPAAPPLSERSVAASAPHRLTARFTEMTWTRVVLDDQQPEEAFYQAGATKTWSAQQKITILLGNSGGVSLTYNGAPVPLTGKSGQVVSLTFP